MSVMLEVIFACVYGCVVGTYSYFICSWKYSAIEEANNKFKKEVQEKLNSYDYNILCVKKQDEKLNSFWAVVQKMSNHPDFKDCFKIVDAV